MKIIFTADIHGNTSQYRKLFSLSERVGAKAVIIGGDIAPKDPYSRTIKSQRNYLENVLLPMIREFYKRTSNKTYILMGNDDFSYNEDLLLNKKEEFEYIHDRVIQLGKWNLAGYSYIPITPFKFKDWEKADVHDKHESEYRKEYVVDGITSVSGKLQAKQVDLVRRNDCIEYDLKKLDANNLILITHSPPFNTKLDVLANGNHAGSIAVMRFIKEHQPVLTLHGHIHETVDMTGVFTEKINNTIIATPGNDPFQEQLKILHIDLETLTIKRLIE